MFLTLLLCLAFVALFAASEAALAMTNRVRLRHLLRQQNSDEGGNAQLLSSEISNDAQKFIATVTIAANLPLVVAASLTLALAQKRFDWPGTILVCVVVALATVAFFQIAPRLLVSAPGALDNLWWVRPARIVVAILRPFVGAFLWLGRLILAPLGLLGSHKPRSEAQNEEEIRDLVEAADASGALSESRELIESIFTFGDTRVHEVMIPRPDIVFLKRDASAAEVTQLFEESGLSRLPLVENSVDEIAGILHIKDVLRCLSEKNLDFSARELLREPLYVPEGQKIEDALELMRGAKTHLAIVMDEFGGTAGLLTVEDILEELVGEIADEHDRREEEPLEILSDVAALADARLHAEDLAARWDLALPVGEFDTVGGFMIEQLGRELRVGDRLEISNAVLTVHSVRGRRPLKIHLVKREPESETEEESDDESR